MNVLTWHVHGQYLYYLTQAPHHFHVVTRPGNPPGYAGLAVGDLPWGSNVHEIAERDLPGFEPDCVLYPSRQAFEERLATLSAAQREAPSFYLEHEPPQQDPTDARHPAADSRTHIVHVSHFNALMWDNGSAPVSVIEHGVLVPPDLRCSGERDEGIVVVDHLARQGRRFGADVYLQLCRQVPMKLYGADSPALGGAGEISGLALSAHMARHRFYFSPVRHASLGLPVVEAMMIGLPVVGLATSELSTVIRNNHNGYIDTRLDRLAEVMKMLIADPALARRWGDAARETALRRFNIHRFIADWNRLLRQVVSREAAGA